MHKNKVIMQNQLGFKLNMITNSSDDMFDELTDAALIEDETDFEDVLNKDTIEYRFRIKKCTAFEFGVYIRRTGRLLDIIFRTNRFKDHWEKSSEFEMTYMGEKLYYYITYNVPRKLHTPENVARLLLIMNHFPYLQEVDMDIDRFKYENEILRQGSIMNFEKHLDYLNGLFGCNYWGLFNGRSLAALTRLYVQSSRVMSVVIQGATLMLDEKHNIFEMNDGYMSYLSYKHLNCNADPETLVFWNFPPSGTPMKDPYFTWTPDVPKFLTAYTKKHLREHPEDFIVYRVYRIDFKFKILFLGFIWDERLKEGAFAALKLPGSFDELSLIE